MMLLLSLLLGCFFGSHWIHADLTTNYDTTSVPHTYGYATCDPSCFINGAGGASFGLGQHSVNADVYHSLLYAYVSHPEGGAKNLAIATTAWAGTWNCVYYDLYGGGMINQATGGGMGWTYPTLQLQPSVPAGGYNANCQWQQGQATFLPGTLTLSIRWIITSGAGTNSYANSFRGWYDAANHVIGHLITDIEKFRLDSYCYDTNVPEPPGFSGKGRAKGHWINTYCDACKTGWTAVATYCQWSQITVDTVAATSGYWTSGQNTMYAYQGSGFYYDFTESVQDWQYLWHQTTCTAYPAGSTYTRTGVTTTINFGSNAYTNALTGTSYNLCLSRSGYSASGYVDLLFTVDIMDITSLQGRGSPTTVLLYIQSPSCAALGSSTTVVGYSSHQLRVSSSGVCGSSIAGTAVTSITTTSITVSTCTATHGTYPICASRYITATSDYRFDTSWRVRTVQVTAIHNIAAGSAIHWYKNYGFGTAPAPAYFEITGSANLDSTTTSFGLALKLISSGCPATAANANEKTTLNYGTTPYRLTLTTLGLLGTVGKYHFCASVDVGYLTVDSTYIYFTNVQFWVVDVLTLDGYFWTTPYTWTKYISDVGLATLTGNNLAGITPAPLIRFHTACNVDCFTAQCTSMTLDTTTLKFPYTHSQTQTKRLNLRLCIHLPTMAPGSSPTLYHDVGMRLQIIPTPTHTATPTHSVTFDNSIEVTYTLSLTDDYTVSMSHSFSETLTREDTDSGTLTRDWTATLSITQDDTGSIGFTHTRSHTVTQEITEEFTSTDSHTLTPEHTGTSTITDDISETRTLSGSQTLDISLTLSLTQERTGSGTYSESLSETQEITEDYTATMTHSPTSEITLSTTMTRSLSFTDSSTDESTDSMTLTFSTTDEPTWTESLPLTRTVSLSLDPTEDPTLSMTHTLTESLTQEQTLTATATDDLTKTLTHTITPDLTLTTSLSETESMTQDITLTMTQTIEPTATESLPLTHTITLSMDPTEDPTMSLTHTFTESITDDWSQTATATDELTRTLSLTDTPELTLSVTLSGTPTFTDDRTMTLTHTVTDEPTFTLTLTETPELTLSATLSISNTLSLTFSESEEETASMTHTVTQELTGSGTLTNTDERTLTSTITSEMTPEVTKSMTLTLSNTLTMTDSITIEKSEDPTKSTTFSNTWSKPPTFTVTIELTSSMTKSLTLSASDPATLTLTTTEDNTASRTETKSLVETITKTIDNSASRTKSRTWEGSSSPSLSKDRSVSRTYSPPDTPSFTPEHSWTQTLTDAYSSTLTHTVTVHRNNSRTQSPTFSEDLLLDEDGNPLPDKNRFELWNISQTIIDTNEIRKQLVVFSVVVYRDEFEPNVTVGPGRDCELESNIPEKWESKGFASKYKTLKQPLPSRTYRDAEGRSILEVQVGMFKDYSLSGDEKIQMTCKASAFRKKRTPNKKVPLFTVIVPDDDPAKQFSKAVKKTEAGGAVLFLVRATPLLPMLGTLSGITSCHNDYEPGYILHPTQISIGKGPHDKFRGMLVANIAITAGALILHGLLAVAMMGVKKLSFARAAGKVRFPGVSYYVVLYFYMGSVCGAYRMVLYCKDVLSLYVLGPIGILWAFGVIACIVMLARTKPVQQMGYVVNAGDYIFQCTNRVWLIPRLKILDSLFFTRAVWLNQDEESDVRYVQRYAGPFWNFREERVWFAWVDLIFLHIFGLVLAFYTPEKIYCAYRALAVLILLFIYMCLDFAFKPHHWTFHTRVSQVCLVLLVIAALLFFLHLIMGEPQSVMNDIGQILLLAVMIILIIAILVEWFGKLYDRQLRKLKNYKDPNRNNKNFVRPDEWMGMLGGDNNDLMNFLEGNPYLPGMEAIEAAGEGCMDPKLLFVDDEGPKQHVVQVMDIKGVRMDFDDDKNDDPKLGVVSHMDVPMEGEHHGALDALRSAPVLRFALGDHEPEDKTKHVEMQPMFKADFEFGDTIEVVEADEDEVQAAVAQDVAFPTVKTDFLPPPPPPLKQDDVPLPAAPPPPPKKAVITKFAEDPTEDKEMRPVAPAIPTLKTDDKPVVTKFAEDPTVPASDLPHRPNIEIKPEEKKAVTKFAEEEPAAPGSPKAGHRPNIEIKPDEEQKAVTKFANDPTSPVTSGSHRPNIDIKPADVGDDHKGVTKYSDAGAAHEEGHAHPTRPNIDIKLDASLEPKGEVKYSEHKDPADPHAHAPKVTLDIVKPGLDDGVGKVAAHAPATTAIHPANPMAASPTAPIFKTDPSEGKGKAVFAPTEAPAKGAPKPPGQDFHNPLGFQPARFDEPKGKAAVFGSPTDVDAELKKIQDAQKAAKASSSPKLPTKSNPLAGKSSSNPLAGARKKDVSSSSSSSSSSDSDSDDDRKKKKGGKGKTFSKPAAPKPGSLAKLHPGKTMPKLPAGKAPSKMPSLPGKKKTSRDDDLL